MRLHFTQPCRVDHEVIWGLIAALGLAASVLLPVDRLLSGAGYRCPLRAIVGVPCPTCGGTRAAVAMGRLRFGRAFAFNPLVAIGWCTAALFVPYAAIVVLWRKNRLRLADVTARDANVLRALVIGVVLANWAYVIASARYGLP